MRLKKIRGHKRRWKTIERWVEANKHLDLEYLKNQENDYTKIWVSPWSNLSLTYSRVPEPKRETKARIAAGLLTIYDSWQKQLDQLQEEYYLKIWLFDPWFSKSQVVCGIGNCLTSYNDVFHIPEKKSKFNASRIGSLPEGFSEFEWEFHWDEFVLDNQPEDRELFNSEEQYLEEIRNKEKMLRLTHRAVRLKEAAGITELYFFKVGHVWVGERKLKFQH